MNVLIDYLKCPTFIIPSYDTFNPHEPANLLLPSHSRNIHYIERNNTEHYHSLKTYPATLSKKVTLLRYFRKYMNEHLLKAAAAMCPR